MPTKEKSSANQDLLRHHKSTTLEDSIRKMESALRYYERRCGAPWLDFTRRLKEHAGTRLSNIEEWRNEQNEEMRLVLFSSLVDVVYRRSFETINEYGGRPLKKINWRSDSKSKIL